jgi:hypothetical protein
MKDLLPARFDEGDVRKLRELQEAQDRALNEALHRTKTCYEVLLILQASFSFVRSEFRLDLGLPTSDHVSRDAHTFALRAVEALFYYSEKYLRRVPDPESLLKREHARTAKLFCAVCSLHKGELPKFCRAYGVVKALHDLVNKKKQKSQDGQQVSGT